MKYYFLENWEMRWSCSINCLNWIKDNDISHLSACVGKTVPPRIKILWDSTDEDALW